MTCDPSEYAPRRTAPMPPELDDQRLASLLDDALSHDALSHDAPPGLSRRVLERTPTVVAAGVRGNASPASDRPGVIARIGVRRAPLLAVAAVFLALLTFGVLQYARDAGLPALPAEPDIAAIERELDRLAAADDLDMSDDTIDARIDELALHLDYVDTSNPWADPEAALLEAAVSEALLRDNEEMYFLF